MFYIVSFNDSQYEIGGYEDGDTIDYYGEDREKVIAYVEKVDSNYPITFVPNSDKNDENLIGYFYHQDDEDCVTAVMYKGSTSDLPIEIK